MHAIAGHGKTSLMAEYIQLHECLAGWLTLDSSDRDYHILLRDIAFLAIGPESTIALNAQSPSTVDQGRMVAKAITVANMLASSGQHRVIFIDNVEILEASPSSLEALGFVVRFTPNYIRFVLSTRHWSAQSNSLIGVSDLEVLSFADLTFKEADLERALAELYDLPEWWQLALTASRLSGGWAHAIGSAQCLCLDSAESPDEAAVIAHTARETSRVTQQVLTSVSNAARHIVTQTMDLDSFTPYLCTEILGIRDAELHLGELLSHGVTSRTREEEASYSVDPVIRRSLMRAQRSNLPKSMLVALSRHLDDLGDTVGSCRCLARAGLLSDARSRVPDIVRKLVNAGQWESLTSLLREFGESTSMAFDPVTMYNWCTANSQMAVTEDVISISSQYIQQHRSDYASLAEIYLTRSYAHRESGDMQSSERDARMCLELTAANSLCRAKALRILSTIHATALESTEADNDFAAALDISFTLNDDMMQAKVLSDLAQFRIIQGRLREASATSQEAMVIADSSPLNATMSMSRNAIGLYWQLYGDYHTAYRSFSEGLLISQRSGWRIVEALLWLSIADLEIDRNRLDEAKIAYRRALVISTLSDQKGYMSYALSGLATIERLAGRLVEAGQLLAEAGQLLEEEQRYDRAVWSIRKAQLLVDERAYGPALDELSGTIDVLRKGQARVELARALVVRANALFLTLGVDATETDLAEVAELVHFIGTGQFLAPLCRRMPRLMRALAVNPHIEAYAAIVGLAPDAVAEPTNGHAAVITGWDDPSPGVLKERELEVALCLCEGLSRAEIAARLSRSKSTVDNTISAIYAATGFEATHQIVAWAYRIALFPNDTRK